jgi:hypothetical protein
MARVYILSQGIGDDERLVGVFATMGDAESARIAHCKAGDGDTFEHELGRVVKGFQEDTPWWNAEIKSALLGIDHVRRHVRSYVPSHTSWAIPSCNTKDGFPIKIGTLVSEDHLRSLADEIVKAHIATWPE